MTEHRLYRDSTRPKAGFQTASEYDKAGLQETAADGIYPLRPSADSRINP